jgi:class 3 adenylate cyclase
VARTENLTIMFTDIAGFTARTSNQSRAENAAMLRQHDQLLLPIVALFRGRRIKSIGDALLVVFQSPTDAVRCGMAMQDALHEHNRIVSSEDALHVRVALNQGEVRVERGDIFGEPVNIAARIESITPANEVYFSESVYLAMTKAEVPSEKAGVHELKGIPEPVTVYRAVPFRNSGMTLPFGGMHQSDNVHPVKVAVAKAMPLVEKARAQAARVPRKARLGSLVFAIAVIALVASMKHFHGGVDGEALLDKGQVAEADARAQKLLAGDANDSDGLLLAGHVAYARENRKGAVSLYERALATDDSLRTNARLVKNLVDALTWVGKPAQDLLVKYPSQPIEDALVERTRGSGYWGRRRAVEALQAIGQGDAIDEGQVALADLKEAPDCNQRLAAVKKLREKKVKAAIPALKVAGDDGFTNHFKNGCLIGEAQAAIKAIESD